MWSAQSCPVSDRYDVVIVGGGSAGCALANRLSADPSTRVLVLEAGRPDYKWDVFIHMPAGLATPIGNRFYDWKYESEPEPYMNGRRIYHARGKVLGGSSSINGMIFQRGNPLDYERWGADPGMGTWDFAHCLPYFKRMETCLAGADEYRGGDGPLVLERGPATNPLFKAFLEAVQQAGYPLTDDVNGYRQEGFAAFDRNIHRGRRLSAARAYLHPGAAQTESRGALPRVRERVLFDGTRAVGVEVAGRVGPERIEAGEVILCGGAINSPQLLQLSGVGNARELEALGVDVVHDLPGVGEHLQDHLEVYIQYGSKQPVSVAPAMKWRNRPWVGFKWLFFRSGPGATNHFEAGGFIRGDDEVAYPEPDVPLPARGDPLRRQLARGRARVPGARRADVLGRPRVGEDQLDGSARPSGAALQLPLDRAGPSRMARRGPCGADDPDPAGVRRVQRRRALTRPSGRRPTRRSSTGWRATPRRRCIRRVPAGWESTTCPSSTRRRCGCAGWRGCASSTRPSSRTCTNGNIYAPVMMVAEKAADLILANTPLPARADAVLPARPCAASDCTPARASRLLSRWPTAG